MAGKEPPISIDIQIAGMIHYLVISNCHATKAKDHASSWSGWQTLGVGWFDSIEEYIEDFLLAMCSGAPQGPQKVQSNALEGTSHEGHNKKPVEIQ